MNHKLMEILYTAHQKLKDARVEESRLEAEILAAHVLKCERHDLYLKDNLVMNIHEENIFFNMLERRCAGEPIQYIIGSKEFMGLLFEVDDRVLIPRCDTEILVETALELLPSDREVFIADIGTGSGAIAVSIAYYMPNAQVFAIDIDEGALCVAKKNANIHGVNDRIQFLKGNMFEPFNIEHKSKFDAILSNPPYIPTNDIDTLSVQVRDHEPQIALDGGKDGLLFYRRMVSEAHTFIREKGFIGFEVGYNQASHVCNMLQNMGVYTCVYCVKDLSGIDRVVVART